MKRQLASWRSWFRRGDKVSISKQPNAVVLPGGESVQIAYSINCIGTICPRPQMLTMNMLETMTDGEVLELITDNPVTTETLPALAMVLCSQHLATVQLDDAWNIYLRKGLEPKASDKFN